MRARKLPCLLAGALIVFVVFPELTADTAIFEDLGFSVDGDIYIFAQYGVLANRRPWADLYVVDMRRNDFVSGGRLSYVQDNPILDSSARNGLSALQRLISQHAALMERYRAGSFRRGKPLHISLDSQHGSAGETIEFRDFERGRSYSAVLIPTIEGSGANLKSSFYIDLEQINPDGSKKRYKVGSPEIKRSRIASYRIQQVQIDFLGKGLIFVIEMKKSSDSGFDIRYMVEAIVLTGTAN
jgi:predicted secreted protein